MKTGDFLKQMLKPGMGILILFLVFAFNGRNSNPFEIINAGLTQYSPNEEKPILSSHNQTAFKRKKKITYRIHYGFMDAAIASLEIKEENKQIGGRNTFHVVGLGITKGSFDWFFKVRDRYETYMDEEAILPWVFIRRVDEGGYKFQQNQVYNHYKNQVDADGKIFTTPENIQDMLSAFYFARTYDFTNAQKGDLFAVTTFMDNEIWDLKIKFVGREVIKTDLGRIKCLKFVPVVQKGRIFKSEEDLKIWISDDVNKIPVRGQCELVVGSLKMDIIEAKGLMQPLTIVKK